MPGQILIVDDLSLSRMILRAKLSSACHNSVLAADGATALALARAHLPDLILMDHHLPDATGTGLCEILRSDPRTRDIPIILITSDTSRETRLAALRAGAEDVLTKPLDETLLMARVRAVLRRNAILHELREQAAPVMRHALNEAQGRFAGKLRIAHVCSAVGRRSCALDAEPRLHDVTMSLPEALGLSSRHQLPDIFLLAPEITQFNGLDPLTELCSRNETRRIPIVVLLPPGKDSLGAMALDLGATDVLRSPLDQEEMRLRLDMIAARKSQADGLRQALGAGLDLASRDPLTGLYNRRRALSHLRDMVEFMSHDNVLPFALLMIDLDFFKRVNDDFGHIAGDEVLVEVTRRMRAKLREGDLLARYGGEEFLLILPRTGAAEARRIAARLCEQIEMAPYPLRSRGESLTITASIGVSVQSKLPSSSGDDVTHRLIDAADQALRRAKRAGRNRIAFRTVSPVTADHVLTGTRSVV